MVLYSKDLKLKNKMGQIWGKYGNGSLTLTLIGWILDTLVKERLT